VAEVEHPCSTDLPVSTLRFDKLQGILAKANKPRMPYPVTAFLLDTQFYFLLHSASKGGPLVGIPLPLKCAGLWGMPGKFDGKRDHG